MLFVIACAVIFALSLYLTLATCYRTGLLGAIGYLLLALGSGAYLGPELLALFTGYGEVYAPSKPTVVLAIGIGLVLLQLAGRAIFHAVRDRIEASHADAARALRMVGGTDMAEAERA